MSFHVVIPSRYGATRLPGKPLRLIAGEPMIAHVHRRGLESGAESVCVATDDQRIVDAVVELGGRAHLTSTEHTSGTDRIAEVAAIEGWDDDAVVVNLQGDEPCMDPGALRRAADLLTEHPDADIATLATPIESGTDLFATDVVKVVLDDHGFARWFSRAPIPWVRGELDLAKPPDTLPPGIPFLRHLGIYAYRVGVLRAVCAAPPHVHERAESLEQLRALAMGKSIAVAVVDDSPGHGVDTEADLTRAEALLIQRDTVPMS